MYFGVLLFNNLLVYSVYFELCIYLKTYTANNVKYFFLRMYFLSILSRLESVLEINSHVLWLFSPNTFT